MTALYGASFRFTALAAFSRGREPWRSMRR
ncbi:hypothetical protein M218_04025 [Burkholderia pseudomallei MSHR338]|nr:hypothetical protein M218_04025 [Burkholderia pseudomallei MSHR338]